MNIRIAFCLFVLALCCPSSYAERNALEKKQKWIETRKAHEDLAKKAEERLRIELELRNAGKTPSVQSGESSAKETAETRELREKLRSHISKSADDSLKKARKPSPNDPILRAAYMTAMVDRLELIGWLEESKKLKTADEVNVFMKAFSARAKEIELQTKVLENPTLVTKEVAEINHSRTRKIDIADYMIQSALAVKALVSKDYEKEQKAYEALLPKLADRTASDVAFDIPTDPAGMAKERAAFEKAYQDCQAKIANFSKVWWDYMENASK